MPASNDKAAFVIVRQFNVPRAVVWKAWSDADQLKSWWGPKGCSLEVARFEFRPGGFFHYAMKFDNAPTMWGRFNYREISAPEHLVCLDSFANQRCGIVRAPFSESYPLEIQTSVTFTEHAGTTTVTLRAEPFGETESERRYFEELQPSLEQGYGGTFEKLADHLAKTT